MWPKKKSYSHNIVGDTLAHIKVVISLSLSLPFLFHIPRQTTDHYRHTHHSIIQIHLLLSGTIISNLSKALVVILVLNQLSQLFLRKPNANYTIILAEDEHNTLLSLKRIFSLFSCNLHLILHIIYCSKRTPK